jgi:hypothetical protein
MDVVLPEVGALRKASAGSGRRLVLILAGVGLFCAVVAFALFSLIGKDSKAAHNGATRFGSALVLGEPRLAPKGDADMVSGVRNYFGAVTSAKVIGSHDRGVNTGDSADTRTYFVVEMLLDTRRGPAALELDFDNHAIGSDRISGIHELEPSEAPGLTTGERSQLARAFAARGGKPADDALLNDEPPASSSSLRVSVPATKHATQQLSAAEKQLRCVQRAKGDVTKMQQCATQP